MGDEFDAVMAEFYGGVRSGRGSLFFAVCRGKARCARGLARLCYVPCPFAAAMYT